MQEVEFYGPGEMPERIEPVDLIFRSGTEPLSHLIRFTTRSDKSHVAIVRRESGEIIHAVQRGVVQEYISKYEDDSYYLVRCPMSDEDRAQCVDWLDWAVGSGFRYDYVTLVMIWVFWVTGGWLYIGGGKSVGICSGLAAQALRAANYRFTHNPSVVIPKGLFDDITSGRAIP